MRRRWMKLTFETTVRELKCTLSMRRYSNDLEMENGGTEVYEKGLHDERTGTVREVIEVVKGKTKGKRNRRSVERENENGVNQRLRR